MEDNQDWPGDDEVAPGSVGEGSAPAPPPPAATPPPPATDAAPSTPASPSNPEPGAFEQRSYPQQPTQQEQLGQYQSSAQPQQPAQPQQNFQQPAAPQQQQNWQQPAQPQQPQQNWQQPDYPEQGKFNLPLVVGAILVFFLLLGGGALLAILAVRGSDETATVDEPDAPAEPEVVEEPEVAEFEEPEVVDEPEEVEEPDVDLPLGSVEDPVAEDTTAITVADGELERFDGEIGPNGFDTFTIDLEAGVEVVVSAEAGQPTLDTVIRVVGPVGNQIDSNDDAAQSANLASQFDSQVIFIVEEEGTHTFEVLGFDAQSVGPYVLTVNRTGEVADSAIEAAPATPVELVLEDETNLSTAANEAEVVEGSLDSPLGFDSFIVDLEAGETVNITVEGADDGPLDPFITLTNPDLGVVGTNDDAIAELAVGRPQDSQLVTQVQQTGTYVIDVTSFAAQTSGAYVFTLERGEGDGAEVAVPELAGGERDLVIEPGGQIVVEGSVALGLELYDIVLEAGDIVIITVEAVDPALDPVAGLRFGENDLGFNDDSEDPTAVNDPFDSQFIISTANTGIHQIFVAGIQGSTGAFTLTVARA